MWAGSNPGRAAERLLCKARNAEGLRWIGDNRLRFQTYLEGGTFLPRNWVNGMMERKPHHSSFAIGPLSSCNRITVTQEEVQVYRKNSSLGARRGGNVRRSQIAMLAKNEK